ncbi:MAG: hypothetical protein R2698_11805 [Microthrixaceae bacterium]
MEPDAAPVEEPDAPPIDRLALGVVLLAVVLRVGAAWWLTRAPSSVHDPLLYQRFAQGIAKGQGYLAFHGTPTSYYPPGYPFFLGAIQWVLDRVDQGARLPMAAAMVQAGLGGTTVWWLFRAGSRLGGRRVGLVAGAIVACWPNLILQSTVLLSEPLFLAVFAGLLRAGVRALDRLRDGSTVAVQRHRDVVAPRQRDPVGAVAAFWGSDRGRRLAAFAVAGAWLGICALVRSQVLVMFAAFAAALWSGTRRRVRAWSTRDAIAALVLVTVTAALVITPWTIRNAVVLGGFVPVSTNGGDNLCVGFNPAANGAFAVPKVCQTGDFYLDGPAAELRRNRDTARIARRWALHHLGALPMLSLRKLYWTYNGDVDGARAVESYDDTPVFSEATRAAVRAISNGYYAIVGLATIAGLVVLTRRTRGDRHEATLASFVVVGTLVSALIPVAFFGDQRFKVAATPLFALCAATALVASTGLRHRDGQRGAPATEPGPTPPEGGRTAP